MIKVPYYYIMKARLLQEFFSHISGDIRSAGALSSQRYLGQLDNTVLFGENDAGIVILTGFSGLLGFLGLGGIIRALYDEIAVAAGIVSAALR